jgi:hypothetical protein
MSNTLTQSTLVLTERLIFGYNIQENTSTNNYPQYSVKLAQNQNTALLLKWCDFLTSVLQNLRICKQSGLLAPQKSNLTDEPNGINSRVGTMCSTQQ